MHDGDEYQHEVASGENIYNHEANNLKTAGAHCTKNPGHEKFIPVKEFKPAHLPADYRDDEDLFKWIKLATALTVKINTKVVSPKRPDGLPGAHKRGQVWPQTGTGFCVTLFRYYDIYKDKEGTRDDKSVISRKPEASELCRCSDCQQSGQPKKSWWIIHIRTAAHLVCDDIEAANSEVVFFYDDIDSETITLPCYRHNNVGTSVRRDTSLLMCILHDGVVSKTLHSLWKSYWNLSKELERSIKTPKGIRRKYYYEEDQPVLIISHPHGSTKQISVGKALNYDSYASVVYYDVPTCRGSSGSPVVWIGFMFTSNFHPHSSGNRKGLGKSCGLQF